MKKMMLKKIFISTFVVVLVTLMLPFLSFNIQSTVKENNNIDKTPLFSNESFITDLAQPAKAVETFISFSDIYAIIEGYRNAEIVGEANSVKNQRDLNIKNAILNLVSTNRVSISSAEELYQLSNAASYNYRFASGVNRYPYSQTIQTILSLDYIILNDIDYSTMRARKFVPLGTNIMINIGTESITHIYPFTGTFDGNGNVISNLYLADYSYITTTLQFNDDESTNIDVALFKHYAMFSLVGHDAVIKNLVLKNPIYELLDATTELTKAAMLVGENNGTIYNVGVIDDKMNQQGLNNSGIRFGIQYATSEIYTAAGFVHTNNGTIKNSYLVSENVIAPGLQFRFNEKPFVYTNTGTLEGLAYNLLLENSTDDNTHFVGVEAYTVQELKSGMKAGNSIHINSASLTNEPLWYFYEQDGYPSLVGLTYDAVNNQFNIYNEYDFVNFTKLINLNTVYKGKTFDAHTYELKDDINMKNIKTIKTPSKVFSGILTGGSTDFTLTSITNLNKYIFNLDISTPYVFGSNYYLGLFNTLSGTVKNINLYNNTLTVKDSKNHYGKTFHVGAVAAVLQGEIKNVISLTNIDLGTDAIGQSYVGGIAGLAKGHISFVANKGHINGNQHNFDNQILSNNYYIGGIVGTNQGTLNLSYSSNLGKVTGLSTTGTNYTSNGSNSYIGGIIGEVNNFTSTGNSILYVTNQGEIQANQIIGKLNEVSNTYAGGIFGSVKGFGFKTSEVIGSNTVVRNGRFENKANITGGFVNTYTKLYAAGIGVMNTTEANSEVSYMTNSGGYQFTNFNHGTFKSHLYYAATIIDNTQTGITMTRAYNTKSFTIDSTFFSNNSGINQSEIRLSLFYASVYNNPSKLMYVENKGNLTVGSAASDTSVSKKLKISNITQATQVDFINVINSGNINVLRLNNTSDAIYVAGITWVLPYINNRAYLMTNTLNEGKIVTAGITGNTTVSSASGMNYSQNNFASTLVTRNVYVAGLVNMNVGKITNSFNMGDITSTHLSNVKDIIGTANTYVGGLVTFNYNLIQDVANSGTIEYTNSSTTSVSHYAGTISGGTNNSTFGGITIAYNGGLTLGGIVAAIGNRNATELENLGRFTGANDPIFAQVLDTSNNGDVFGKAKEYVRSGGILGIALGVELASGTYNNSSTTANITPGPFGKSVIGTEDSIKDAVLSNGLNFGNISAVTSSIGQYPGTVGTGSAESDATAQRPGINASAGGVIAYGLTKMKRMLNHGVISSTDVAGGVVGATYILGSVSTTNYVITPIEIDTAVHYGKVKAIKSANYASIVYNATDTFNSNNLTNHAVYYADNDTTFVFPTSAYDLATYPNRKRGFGGIFGRMQRGNRGAMQGENFINIMNMDPNVDMIGRADANTPLSLVFYRFFNPSRPETYYTARTNDTTGAAVVGWLTNKTIRGSITNANNISFIIQRTRSQGNFRYHVLNDVTITNGTANIMTEAHTRMKMNYNGTATSTITYNVPVDPNATSPITTTIASGYTSELYSADYDISRYGLTAAQVQGLFTSNTTVTYTTTNYDLVSRMNVTNRTPFTNILISQNTNTYQRYNMQRITDNALDTSALSIFDPTFPLMDPSNADFIYQADKDVLASKFQTGGTNEKPIGGMYVLASTEGRANGAVLPSNLKVNQLFRLNESTFSFVDLLNVSASQQIQSGVPGSSVENMISAYQDMFQLKFNDKSLVLPQINQPTLADLVLYDPTNNSPILSGGIINNNNHTITYNVSNAAFSQNNFNYKVKDAKLSENAVIAKNNITSGEHTAFHNAYNNRDGFVIRSGSFEATFSGSVTSGNQTSFQMTVYSQISANDVNLITKYKQVYTIIINRLPGGFDLSSSISVDGAIATTTTVGNAMTVTSPQLLPNGTLAATITETSNLLPSGHQMVIHALYLGVNVIDPSYYSYVVTPKLGNQLGFSITLSDLLQAGTYRIEYGYYQNATKYTLNVTKQASSAYQVKDMSYETYSEDIQNEVQTFTPVFNDFVTYIEFGYIFEGVTKVNQALTLVAINQNGLPTYVEDVLYYEVYLGNNLIIDRIKIAPFAVINSATIRFEYTALGIKHYIITYQVKAETTGVNTIPIVQTIKERNLAPMMVYKDDNLQLSNSITVTREAFTTRIDVDFNFIFESLNDDVLLSVLKDGIPYTYTLDELYYESGYYYHLVLTSLLEKGMKTYEFTLSRDGGAVSYLLGTLDIEKLLGVNAYLDDIHFQIDSSLTIVYPIIRALDSNLVPNNAFDTRVYFDGIDYANADLENIKLFRINGKVSDIVLEEYSPQFSLPFGATIERFDGVNWTTNLNDNFLGEENLEAVIIYRVISEDGQNTVVYHITATDVKYNLTLKFNIYYEFANQTIVSADDNTSPIKNNVVLITLKNLKLNNSFDPLTSNYDEANQVYPNIVEYIDGINSQSTLFYFTNPSSNYIYRFGRNSTGAYNFSVISPVYTGPTTAGLVKGERYNYTIYLTTNVTGSWHQAQYELPMMDDNGEFTGRYYYIQSTSSNQIIREFAIVIKESTSSGNWGLYDDYTSWDQS